MKFGLSMLFLSIAISCATVAICKEPSGLAVIRSDHQIAVLRMEDKDNTCYIASREFPPDAKRTNMMDWPMAIACVRNETILKVDGRASK